MSNKNADKKYAAENSETGTSARQNETDDLPPPYTPYAPSSAPKPPPPAKPPALTQEPPPATTTRIIPGPGPQMTDNDTSTCSAWEGCKAACCSVLRWPLILCFKCITCSTCAHACPEPKPRQNR